MTAKTQCLKVRAIQEQVGITFMLHDVIDGKVCLDGAAYSAGVARIHEDLPS